MRVIPHTCDGKDYYYNWLFYDATVTKQFKKLGGIKFQTIFHNWFYFTNSVQIRSFHTYAEYYSSVSHKVDYTMHYKESRSHTFNYYKMRGQQQKFSLILKFETV